MHGLPRTLVGIDGSTLAQNATYERLDPGAGPLKRLKEKDYDELIARHKDVFGDLLQSAGLIEPSSRLKYLGRQIKRIDVLFAEVDSSESFRRLVIVEDKLLRNPEASRSVLAQILEYADTIQRLPTDELAESLADEHQEWLDDNREDVEASLRAGDFLLMICGDKIHPRVARLAGRFAGEANPLSQVEVALVALQFYAAQDRLLLVPSLVGSVTRGERDLTIRVRVVDTAGAELKAVTVLESKERKTRRVGDEDQFFSENWKRFDPADVSACRSVLASVEAARIPGLVRDTLPSGRPVFDLVDTPFGVIRVLQVAHVSPTVRDTPDKSKKVLGDPSGLAAWRAFQERLRAISGAKVTGTANQRVHVPVRGLAANGAKDLIEALFDLATRLRRP